MDNFKYLIAHAWKNNRRIFPYMAIFSIINAIRPLSVLLYAKFVIQIVMNQGISQEFMVGGLFFIIVFILASYIGSYMESVLFTMVMGLRNSMTEEFAHVCMTMRYEYTEDSNKLDEMNMAFQAVSNNKNGIEGAYHKMVDVFTGIVSLCVYCFILLSLQPILVVIILLGTGISTMFLWYANKKEYYYKKKERYNRRYISELLNIMSDYSYGKDIRIFHLQRMLTDKFKLHKDSFLDIREKSERTYFIFEGTQSVFQSITMMAGVLVLIYYTQNTVEGIASFIIYYQAILAFEPIIRNLFEDMTNLRKQNLLILDFRRFLLNKDDKLKYPIDSNMDSQTKDLVLDNVSFNYSGQTHPTLKNISLTIKPGEKIGIVGENGAGKTTLIKILMRLYDDYTGRIQYGGKDIQTMDKEEYISNISPIFQENIQLAFSIAENITCGFPVNDTKIDKVIDICGLKEKVESLPNKKATNLQIGFEKDSVDLSGGELQKLMFARSLYKDGGIYIFDEPTSHLDPIAESNFYKTVADILKDKTVIFISHRLITTVFCDTILCMKDGEIIERGNHRELMEKNGEYSKMYGIQSSYYDNGDIYG